MADTRLREPVEESAAEQLARDDTSRKKFLKMMGGAGAASAFALVLAACGDDDEDTTTGGQGGQTGTGGGSTQADTGDVEIVNYALTLEHLEAAFYQQVIDSGQIKDQQVADLAMRIGENEQEHVDALTATVEQLGGKPAEAPKTNFDKVLEGGPEVIIKTAATVENVGAAAYLGQAAKIKSPDILAAALSIHTVEARHAAAVNQLAGIDFKGPDPYTGTIPDGAFAKPAEMKEVFGLIKPFLAS